MKKSALRTFILLFLFSFPQTYLMGQNGVPLSNFYADPYSVNPSFVGYSGYTSATLNFRQEFAGLNDAPKVASGLFHLPLNEQLALGLNIQNDENGVLTTSNFLATFGYRIYLGSKRTLNHTLNFGLSAGVGRRSINLDEVENPSDPALANASSSLGFASQFGVNYTIKNLQVGFALPRLFQPQSLAEESFGDVDFDPLGSAFASLSYKIKLNNALAFEPWLTYRTNNNVDGQFEALGLLHIKNLVWIGGSYRQDFGATIFIGVNIAKKARVAYAYELASNQVNKIGQGTHEFQLSGNVGQTDKYLAVRPDDEPVDEDLFADESDDSDASLDEPVKDEVSTEKAGKDAANTPSKAKDTSKEDKVKIKANEKPVVDKGRLDNQVNSNKKTEQNQPDIIKNELKSDVRNNEEKTSNENFVKDEGLLKPGHYIIVGAFTIKENGLKYIKEAGREGQNLTMKFHTKTQLYYIIYSQHESNDEAKSLLRSVQEKYVLDFPDAWVFSIN